MKLDGLKMLGIDAAEGLAYCADDPEFYEEMLEEFLTEAAAGAEALDRFCEAEDWDNYRICAHTLKTTARIIGAKGLSERARLQEAAAKERDRDAIAEGHLQMMEEYRSLSAQLADRLG